MRKARADASQHGRGVQRDGKYTEAGLPSPLWVGTQGVSHGVREEWGVGAPVARCRNGVGTEGHILP